MGLFIYRMLQIMKKCTGDAQEERECIVEIIMESERKGLEYEENDKETYSNVTGAYYGHHAFITLRVRLV
jgi:hypothetical protein